MKITKTKDKAQLQLAKNRQVQQSQMTSELQISLAHLAKKYGVLLIFWWRILRKSKRAQRFEFLGRALRRLDYCC